VTEEFTSQLQKKYPLPVRETSPKLAKFSKFCHLGATVKKTEIEAIITTERCKRTGISAQGVLQLRSGRRDHEAAKARFPIPNFIVSIAKGPKWRKYVP